MRVCKLQCLSHMCKFLRNYHCNCTLSNVERVLVRVSYAPREKRKYEKKFNLEE